MKPPREFFTVKQRTSWKQAGTGDPIMFRRSFLKTVLAAAGLGQIIPAEPNRTGLGEIIIAKVGYKPASWPSQANLKCPKCKGQLSRIFDAPNKHFNLIFRDVCHRCKKVRYISAFSRSEEKLV